MGSIATLAGIDEALSNLNYRNEKALKYRLINAIRGYYTDESSVQTIQSIESDDLVKLLWDTGDDPAIIKNRRKNLNSIKSSINADLKERYKAGRNSEGIIIGPDNVFLCATHTHTGPAVVSALGTNADEAYTEQFIKMVAGSIKMANDRLADAELGMASGSAPGWAFPRRYWMKDGTVRMHPRKGDPDIVRVQGEADPELNVLYVKDQAGKYMAAMVKFPE